VAARLAWPSVDCQPSVVGPVPITETSQPYRGLLVGPPKAGYLEEEFFIACAAFGQSYQTLLHVRRPANPQAFSGTVVVEPTHPLGLWPITATTASYQADAGHASVAVVSTRPVLEFLVRGANPIRYAALEIPDIAGIEGEILAQVGALLKSDRSPIPGRRVEHAILGGYSNTGAVVREFIASQHDRARLPDGASVYDGYFPVQTAVGSAPTAIPDLDVPVIEIQGESEVIRTFERGFDQLGYRRPDSDVYRLYEVAGMSHVTSRPGDGFLPNPYRCVEPFRSTFPNRHVWSNALRNLVVWIDDGTAPPAAPRIELDADGRTVVRDEHGNAVGGVRTSYLDVPLATYGAVSTNAPDAPAGSRCDFFSYAIVFTREEFEQLYGSPRAYLRAVRRRLNHLVRDRWYLRHDANELLREAIAGYASRRRADASLGSAPLGASAAGLHRVGQRSGGQ
jgi:Alpha/beta hydrolase domain